MTPGSAPSSTDGTPDGTPDGAADGTASEISSSDVTRLANLLIANHGYFDKYPAEADDLAELLLAAGVRTTDQLPEETVVVDWGVQHPDGDVETGGIDPGGHIVARFSEDVCRYLAHGRADRTLVNRRRSTFRDQAGPWTPAA